MISETLNCRVNSYPKQRKQRSELWNILKLATVQLWLPFEVHAKMFEARVANVELLAVDGGEHVAIFTHRNMVRIKVIDFMQRHFTA